MAISGSDTYCCVVTSDRLAPCVRKSDCTALSCKTYWPQADISDNPLGYIEAPQSCVISSTLEGGEPNTEGDRSTPT
jgi:hypothetical protein